MGMRYNITYSLQIGGKVLYKWGMDDRDFGTFVISTVRQQGQIYIHSGDMFAVDDNELVIMTGRKGYESFNKAISSGGGILEQIESSSAKDRDNYQRLNYDRFKDMVEVISGPTRTAEGWEYGLKYPKKILNEKEWEEKEGKTIKQLYEKV